MTVDITDALGHPRIGDWAVPWRPFREGYSLESAIAASFASRCLVEK